jgi:hypothetical protein
MLDHSQDDQTRIGVHAGRSGRRIVGRVIAVAAALAVFAVTAAGCSSTSTSTSTSTSSSSSSTGSTPSGSASSAKAGSSTATSYPAGKEQVCQARDQLKTSITALTNPSLLLGGTSAIKSAVDQVQTDLTALGTAAKDDYKPQVSAMQTSMQSLETAMGDLGNGDVTKNLQTVGTDIAAVGTAAADLFTQLKATCGS